MTGGRSVPPSRHSGDDGSADPRLDAALRAYGDGSGALRDVVAAVSEGRLLVPVVASRDEGATDLAMVTLRGKDGRVAVPAFTSLAAMASWDSGARPVPAEARRVALSAVADGADVLVLDVAGPVPCVVPRPALWALAQGRPWTPSPLDRQVVSEVEATCTAHPAVVAARCEAGARAELSVVLTLRPGLDRAALDDLTRALADRLAALQIVAERVESMEMRITPA